MTATIKLATGAIIPLYRDVCHHHPAAVHEQLNTGGEVGLQHMLDQMSVDDYYAADGRHLGPDCFGVALFRDDEEAST